MQKWKVTFVDDHGETVNEVFECTERPDYERAARLIKARLLPVAAELDLNDLEAVSYTHLTLPTNREV